MAKVDDSLGTNHLAACCDEDDYLLKIGFELVTLGASLAIRTKVGFMLITTKKSFSYLSNRRAYLTGIGCEAILGRYFNSGTLQRPSEMKQ